MAVDRKQAVGSRSPVAVLAVARAAVRPVRVSAVWAPFLVSRLVVWTVGILAAWLRHDQLRPFDPTGLTASLGHTGHIIAGPAVRWDAVWYLNIAQHGYQHNTALPDFFPLYPLLIRAVSWSRVSAVVAGIVISLVGLWLGLELLYRLVEMDFGSRPARATVWLLALFPMSFFFSAVYTESLFLALSVGCIYLARRERWLWAGGLGALASATRNVGVLLVIPAAVVYLEQLRVARSRPGGSRPGSGLGNVLSSYWQAVRRGWRDWAPRWRGLLGIAMVPVGLVAYILAMGITDGTPLAMFNSHEADRGVVFPVVTIVREITWTVHHLGIRGSVGHLGLGLLNTGLPELGFLVLALVCAVGTVRRLHPAYGAYVVVALLALLTEPSINQQPLTSFPRYIMVLFPLWIWLAVALCRRRVWGAVLGLSTLLLAVFTAQFAAWYFVA